jgi:long-chain acyl-CoA synthetase
VPVNTRLARPELRAILSHAEPTVVLAGSDTDLGGPWAAEPEAATHPPVVVTSGTAGWSAWLDADSSPLPPPPGADGAMDIMYTSGTTGTPKAVVVRHRSTDPDGRRPSWNGLGFMTSSPFSTTSGALLVYGPMRGGLSGWYQPRFDPGQWLSLVETHRPVATFLVPAMVHLIVADPRFEEADLSSLAALTIGGAPITRATLRKLGARLPRTDILVGYGLTEFGAVTRSPSGDRGQHLGSAGTPLPGVEIRIVDDDGAGLPTGQVGEITVRGSEPQREYYKAQTGAQQPWREGWLYSGDLGYLDDDGFLWITGRTKDIIIRGGHNITPGEVEEVIYAHPAVVEAVVAGIPHDVLGEDVGAWVVLSNGSETSATELREFLLERLADYKVPRQLQVVDQLPRNASGKVVKAELVMANPAGSSPGHTR